MRETIIKTSQSICGGFLRKDPQLVHSYDLYFSFCHTCQNEAILCKNNQKKCTSEFPIKKSAYYESQIKRKKFKEK